MLPWALIRLPIPPWPMGQMIPVLLKAWSTVMPPDLRSIFVGVSLELCRTSGLSGLAGRMPVPRFVLLPSLSNSDAESEPLVVPLMHLDRSASSVAASLVAVVDRATLIHVHL